MLGYIVDDNSNLIDIKDFIDEYKDFSIVLIHHGFPNGKDLKEASDKDNVKKNISLLTGFPASFIKDILKVVVEF